MEQEEFLDKGKEFEHVLFDFKQREKEISELLLATKSILKSEDFSITAKEIFDSCSKIIGAKAGYVALLSDDGEENELLFLEDGGMPCSVNPNLPMPIRGLREESYKTGKVVFHNDFMKSEHVTYMPKGHMALKNVLFSPLNIENKTVGIMGMACKDGDFTEHDARVAAAFGDYAAIALQNSRNIDKLKFSNATKDKFLSIIAHDLIGPLGTLLGLSDALLMDVENMPSGNTKKLIELINYDLKNTNELVINLLDWSRAQAGKMEFLPEEIELHDIVDQTFNLLASQSHKKNIELNNLIPPKIKIEADKNMLQTVFRNLISNAIKYTHVDGNVAVSASVNETNLHCTINDNGVGMKSEELERLFKIEYTLSKSGTANEKGTGLGLLLCKELIEKHKGTIGVNSELGKGSEFWFTIPLLAD